METRIQIRVYGVPISGLRLPLKQRGSRSRHATKRERTAKRRRRVVSVEAKKQVYTQVEPTAPPVTPPSQPSTPVHVTPRSESLYRGSVNWLMPLAALVLGALLYNPVRKRFRPSIVEQSMDEEMTYRRAVARTRQAVYVNRAITFMNTNAPARVMVEMQRALKENAICRSELFVSQHSAEEFKALYKMHLRNDEVPPDYATLLQLRQMLGISTDVANQIEREISKTDAFVI